MVETLNTSAREPSPPNIWYWLAGAIVAIGLGWLYHLIAYANERAAYSEEWRRINANLQALETRQPDDVGREEWAAHMSWASRMFTETFPSPRTTELDAIVWFRERLEEKLQEKIDRSFTEWMEQHIVQTGPAGREYVERFGPANHEEIKERRRLRQ